MYEGEQMLVPPEHADKQWHWIQGCKDVGPEVWNSWPNQEEIRDWVQAGNPNRYTTAQLVGMGYRYLGPAEWHDRVADPSFMPPSCAPMAGLTMDDLLKSLAAASAAGWTSEAERFAAEIERRGNLAWQATETAG